MKILIWLLGILIIKFTDDILNNEDCSELINCIGVLLILMSPILYIIYDILI